MKATRKDIEFYQENMDRLQAEKAAEAARADALQKRIDDLVEESKTQNARFDELLKEMRGLRLEVAERKKRNAEKDERIKELTAQVSMLIGQLANAMNAETLNRGKRFKRTTEQTDLLNKRKRKNEEDRADEKDRFDGNPPSAGAPDAEDTPASTPGKSRKPRPSADPDPCACSEIVNHSLEEYFQLPEGARIIMRKGRPDISKFYFIETVPAKTICHIYEVVRYMSADNETFESSLPEEVRSMTPVPGCPLSYQALSLIILYRFGLHLPAYRVRDALRDMGLNLSNSVIDRYYSKSEDELRIKLGELFHQEVRDGRYMMIDETTALVRVKDKETGETAYFKRYIWAFFNKEKNLVEYVYEEGSRSREVLKKFFRTLENLKLTITADGYSAYRIFETDTCPEVLRCGCLTHARRCFIDSLVSARKDSMAMIEEMDALFLAESVAKDLPDAERLKWRQENCTPILNRIKSLKDVCLADSTKMSDSLFAKAVNYLNSQWQTYENIMKSGLAEISNNLCEQRMKPLKLSLKNSQNIGSEDAAKRHCFMHSLVESCRLLGVSIYDYLCELFRRLPLTPKADRGQLLPHVLSKSLQSKALIPIFSRSSL